MRWKEKLRKRKHEFRGVDSELLPFWIQAWECPPLCCSSSGQGSFFPCQTPYWEPFLGKKRRVKNKRLPICYTPLMTKLPGPTMVPQPHDRLRLCSFYSPGVLLAIFAAIGYGPGPPWFIIPCMLFMPGPYGEPDPIMPGDMFG